MKAKTLIIVVGLCLVASAALAATVKVITQEAVIRKDKRFFAPALVRAPFGTALEQLGKEGDWFRVSYQGQEGWIHQSSIQEQKFQLSSLAGGQADEASRDEVALAGKGFNPEVEKAFRDKNPKMRYDLVNQVQAYRVEDQRLQAFIQAGRLQEPGGGK